ncbi:GNAT family N-acetyltransferase [Streptomyces sp. MI02-7b]|uniref:GNAT family N-acetyltransferase n=1 Tax=Streptomyces sp. MI02-7b TaxID=462941 RepID=UPI0029B7A9C3|nr:GNAT family N-acetyltransferase [Streptomyces sp. MI02-7b]MDX3077921.1 GNAT family N-acetyltransferase [Streptomyces sp. MI02-7b]
MTVEVRIEPWGQEDLALLRRTNAPAMMTHLGGPETEEQLLARHWRYLLQGGEERGGMFRIVLPPTGEPVGTIGFWERTWRGETVYETGWSVLPEYQGRGIAVAAGREIIGLAMTAEGGPRSLHAYPKVDNPPSNAICRRLGFTLVGECDFEYPAGNPIRCNDWRLELTAAG